MISHFWIFVAEFNIESWGTNKKFISIRVQLWYHLATILHFTGFGYYLVHRHYGHVRVYGHIGYKTVPSPWPDTTRCQLLCITNNSAQKQLGDFGNIVYTFPVSGDITSGICPSSKVPADTRWEIMTRSYTPTIMWATSLHDDFFWLDL